jgi:outer membrane protein OmpA-like peptidoglycan-associated protein
LKAISKKIISTDLGRQLSLGVDVNRRFSVEVHSADLGSAGLAPEGSINYHDHGASALVYFGRSDNVEKREGLMGFGRVGGGVMENSAEGEVPYLRSNTQHIHLGAGLEYMTKGGLGMRAEFVSYDKDVLYSQLALLYRFGKRSPDKVFPAAEITSGAVVPAMDLKEPSFATNNVPLVEDCEVKTPLTVVAQYKSDSSVSTERSLALIEPVLKQLVNCLRTQIVLTGHADSIGRADYNLLLSERRVASIKGYLVQLGISRNRISDSALGETRPVAPNSSVEGRRLNRRVEIQLK